MNVGHILLVYPIIYASDLLRESILVNISHLRTFITVVDAGSFSEAARLLGLSQPAVTMQIQNLEQRVGQALLDRRYRRIELTEAGQILIPYARKILGEADAALVAIEEQSGVVSGVLNVAVSTTPGDYIVPRLLGEYLLSYPHVAVNLSVSSSGEVANAVESGKADVGLMGAPVKGRRLHIDPIGHDELVLIAHPRHRLCQKVSALSEVTSEPWVMRSDDSGTQQVVNDFFETRGIQPETLPKIMELGTGEGVVSAVEGGLGLAIVSRLVAEKALALGTVHECSIEGLPIKRPFYIVKPHRMLSKAGDSFVRYLSEKLKLR